LPVVMHVTENQASQREVRRVVGSSLGSSWQLYVTTIYLYMLGTTTTLSMLFQVLGYVYTWKNTLLRSSCNHRLCNWD